MKVSSKASRPSARWRLVGEAPKPRIWSYPHPDGTKHLCLTLTDAKGTVSVDLDRAEVKDLRTFLRRFR